MNLMNTSSDKCIELHFFLNVDMGLNIVKNQTIPFIQFKMGDIAKNLAHF